MKEKKEERRERDEEYNSKPDDSHQSQYYSQ